MDLSNAIRQRVTNIASDEKISIHKLSTLSGIPYSTVKSFMVGKSKNMTLTTILHICEGSNMQLKDFWNDKLFKNLEPSKGKRKNKWYYQMQ